MFSYHNPSNNCRFGGTVTVTIGNEEYTISAPEFELAEAGTRNLGDGDEQYEELWVADAPLNEDTGESANFDRIHVHVTRFNDGPFEFYGQAEVRGAPNVLVRVDDSLELNESDKQGPCVEPY